MKQFPGRDEFYKIRIDNIWGKTTKTDNVEMNSLNVMYYYLLYFIQVMLNSNINSFDNIIENFNNIQKISLVNTNFDIEDGEIVDSNDYGYQIYKYSFPNIKITSFFEKLFLPYYEGDIELFNKFPENWKGVSKPIKFKNILSFFRQEFQTGKIWKNPSFFRTRAFSNGRFKSNYI